MKPVTGREIAKFERSLRIIKDEKYLEVLEIALSQHARLSGDEEGLNFLRRKDFQSLLGWADSLVAVVHATADLHFAANQVASLIRKYPWNPSDVKTDPESTAKRTFRASEHRCKRMNQWFRLRRVRPRLDTTGVQLERMRSWIRYVLNDAPNLPSIYDQCDFTGGAAIGVHGDATNLSRKLTAERWTVTPSALPYFAAALCNNFHYATRVARRNAIVQSLHVSEEDMEASVQRVSANKVAFVPKTAKTYRSIAVEPLGNGFLQKGVDLFMRNRLKKVGLDLSDQSRNQELARQGSVLDSEESFCTIDLTSASDSISVELVRELLPPDWFNFLNRIRSPSYMLDGVEYRSEKFCTMGNGFCFPLETLIFAAACHGVNAGTCGQDFIVYGDDIIVRRKAFSDVIRLLSKIGFKTNRKKTFGQGPFRESCGSNWYYGEDVTPFTLDSGLDKLESLFKFVNLSRRNNRTTIFLSECVRAVLALIPNRLLFLRPYQGSPGSGIDLRDLEFTPRFMRYRKYFTVRWLELDSRPVKDVWQYPSWVVEAAALRGHPSDQLFTYRRKVVVRVRETARSGDLRPLTLSFGGNPEAFARKVLLTKGLPEGLIG